MWKQNCLPSDTVHYLKVYRFVSTVYFTFTKIIYLVDYPCTSISRDICVRIFWFLEELNQSSLHHDVHHYSWIHHIFVVLGHLKIGQGGWTPGGLSPCTWGPWCRADTPHEPIWSQSIFQAYWWSFPILCYSAQQWIYNTHFGNIVSQDPKMKNVLLFNYTNLQILTEQKLFKYSIPNRIVLIILS